MSVEPTDQPKKTGRPSALTPDRHAAIMQVVKSGVPWKWAARAAGVQYATMNNWRQRGLAEIARRDDGEPPNEAEEPFVSFVYDLDNAREQSITTNLLNIQQAARGGYITETTTRTMRDGSKEITEKRTAPDWRAAAKALSFHAPADFAERQLSQVEVTGAGGGPVQVESLSGLAGRIAQRRKELENIIEGEVVEDDE